MITSHLRHLHYHHTIFILFIVSIVVIVVIIIVMIIVTVTSCIGHMLRLVYDCYFFVVIFQGSKEQALLFVSVFAFCQAVTYAMYAGALHFGACLIEIGDMEAVDVYRQVIWM